MLKNFTSKIIVVLLFVMTLMSSQAFSRQFGGSLGNALKTTSMGNKSISEVFGKGNMTNIYSTSLGIVRGNQTNVAFASIDAIMKLHPEFVACYVTADDVLNVLYDSNADFRLMLKLTVMNKSKKRVSEPSEREVLKSYKAILRCWEGGISFLKPADSENVRNVLNSEYKGPIDTILNQQVIKQFNFGDDIFQNGTLNDSDYDLLVDIEKIGKKFFESFTTSPPTLFYEMFQPSGNTGGPGGDPSGGGGPQPGSTTTIIDDVEPPHLTAGAVTDTETSTPKFSFTSSEAGILVYTGLCSGATIDANSGTNTITFNALNTGIYTNCKIKVTDNFWNASSRLSVPPFSIMTGVAHSIVPPVGLTSLKLLSDSDASVQDFIKSNNTQVFPPSNLYALPPSACSSGISAEISLPSGGVMTPDKMAEIIQNYIDKAGTDYGSEGSTTFPTSSPPSPDGSPTDPIGSPNEWVEQAMDSMGGSCEDCNYLPEGDKQACQTDCMVACIAKCDDAKTVDLQSCEDIFQATLFANRDKSDIVRALLEAQARTDKTSCQSDANGTKLACEAQCLCFTIGGPLGKKWEGMENMYKIKFCTIPVQVSSVSKGKKVYSIEDIFNEIRKVFDALVNKGEMMKRVPAKEFFDTTLADLKFGELFSFQIVTQIKPLFARISKSTLKKELTQTNDNYESAILEMTPDDKNKYVIVADIAGNKVESENFANLTEYNKKVAALNDIELQSTLKLPAALKVASDDNVTNLNGKVKEFMISNMNFWKTASTTLKEITNLAGLLKTAIESKG